ncbi:MAG: DUF4440 domain-containing protein [Acidobacteria bacterium]|nr:DUF4440 domain-containing protein [Acidobacteriota bacterium]
MNRQKLACLGFVLSIFAILSVTRVAAQDGLPVGWMKTGGKPANYDMTVDTSVKHGGQASASLQFVGKLPDGNTVLMQQFKPDAYRGKRLRMSAWVKTEKAEDRAQLWLRIDAVKNTPGFDNMNNRRITGVTDWRRYELVLDVPNETINIAFGAMSFGTGRVWVDDFAFDVVGNDVAVTDMNTPEQRAREVDNSWMLASKFPAAPVNLDFEGGANPVRKPVAINPKVLDDYVGYYEIQGFVGGVRRKGDALIMDSDSGSPEQVYPLSESEFFFKGAPGSLRFARDAQGKVTEVVANMSGGERHVKRIDLAAAKPRGEQIMAAAWKAKGGLDKLKGVHNIWHDGERIQPGQPTTTFDLYISENNQSFSENRNADGKFVSKTTADGKNGWTYDGVSKNAHDLARLTNSRYHWQFVWLEVSLLPFAGATMETYALDDGTFESKPVDRVLVIVKEGVKDGEWEGKYILHFDKQTHLLRRITATNPNGRTDYAYDDYFDVNGVKLAGLAVINSAGGKYSIKISNYKLNAGLGADRLATDANNNSPEAQLILKQEEAWRLARLNNDVAALKQLVSEDYVGTNQFGERRNKAGLLQLFAPGNIKILSFTVDQSIVRVSGDTATVNGEHTSQLSGQSLSHQFYTHVWIKRDGRWQLLSNTQFVDPNQK